MDTPTPHPPDTSRRILAGVLRLAARHAREHAGACYAAAMDLAPAERSPLLREQTEAQRLADRLAEESRAGGGTRIVSNYKPCPTCRRYDFLDRHACPPRWRAWIKDRDEHPDDNPDGRREVFANSAENAAARAVEDCDDEHDYVGTEVEVFVRCADGRVTGEDGWCMAGGEMTVTYSARKAKPKEIARRFPIKMSKGEDGGFTMICPLIPGCISQGATRSKAWSNIREAIKLCIETRDAEGATWPMPEGEGPIDLYEVDGP